jgi:hypothetical protein
MALARMEEFDPWETCAAARVWLELGTPLQSDVVDRITQTDPELHGAWREALRRIPRARVAELLPPRELPANTHTAAVLVYAWGAHDMLPEALAASAAFDTSPLLRYFLARALGWCASTNNAQQLLQTLLSDPDDNVRRAALWSTALAQPQVAANLCRQRIRASSADFFDFRTLGLLGGATPDDLAMLSGALSPTSVHGAEAAQAIGALGNATAVSVLLNLLDEGDEVAGAAALQAVEMIIGTIPAAAPALAAPEEEDDAAPAPDVALLREWWRENAAAFPANSRYLRGQPFPWSGQAAEEPMEAVWKSLFHYSRPHFEWLRNEVPVGFFEAELRSDAVPGE